MAEEEFVATGTLFADGDRPRGIDGVEVAAIDGGIAVLCEATQTLHQLRGLAGSTWLLCDGRTPVGAMARELSELSGVPAAELRSDVLQALDSLAGAGLIEGIEVPWLVADPPAVPRAPDGSRILAGTTDPCGADADRSVWAGSVALRIGEARDALCTIRGDSAATLETLRTLLAHWIEPEPPAEVLAEKALFSVWLTPLDEQATGARPNATTPRTVPHLRCGSRVMARSRRPDGIVRALTFALGGVHVRRDDDGRTWIWLRPFVRGDAMVLADIDRPEMVNDPRLADRGVIELPAPAVVVEPGGEVLTPPPLPDLAWAAIGVKAPDPGWQRYRLRGIVSMRAYPREPGEQLAKVVRHSYTAHWFRTATAMADTGTIVHVTDHPAVRDEMERRLR